VLPRGNNVSVQLYTFLTFTVVHTNHSSSVDESYGIEGAGVLYSYGASEFVDDLSRIAAAVHILLSLARMLHCYLFP
jgi:hypothetical protein